MLFLVMGFIYLVEVHKFIIPSIVYSRQTTTTTTTTKQTKLQEHQRHLNLQIIQVIGVCQPSQSARKKKEKPTCLCAPREFLKQMCRPCLIIRKSCYFDFRNNIFWEEASSPRGAFHEGPPLKKNTNNISRG